MCRQYSWTSNISAAKYGFQTKCKSLTTAGVLVRCNRCLFQSIRPYTQFILDIGLSYQTLYLSDSVQVKSTKRVLRFQLFQIMVTNIITVIKPAIALTRVSSVPSRCSSIIFGQPDKNNWECERQKGWRWKANLNVATSSLICLKGFLLIAEALITCTLKSIIVTLVTYQLLPLQVQDVCYNLWQYQLFVQHQHPISKGSTFTLHNRCISNPW